MASKTDWKRHLKIIIFEVGLEGGQNPAPRERGGKNLDPRGLTTLQQQIAGGCKIRYLQAESLQA